MNLVHPIAGNNHQRKYLFTKAIRECVISYVVFGGDECRLASFI